MNSPNELRDIARFLLEYANRLMGSGVHTSRVMRNTRRIGESLNWLLITICVIIGIFLSITLFHEMVR